MSENANADLVLVDSDDRPLGESLRSAPVAVVDETADETVAPSRSTITCIAADDRSGRTAALMAAGLALFGSRSLTVVASGSRRRWLADLNAVAEQGVSVSVQDPRRHRDNAVSFTVAGSDEGDPAVPVPVTVVDNTETSEESLGDRVAMLYPSPAAPSAPTRAADDPSSPNIGSSSERH